MERKPKLLLAVSLTLGMASAMAYAQSPATQAKQEKPSHEIHCNEALFQFLPGDFNFCVALKMWARKDYDDAEQMLLLAAGWGSKPAQHMLGLAYLNGAGIDQDRPLGLAWLDIAAERNDPTYLAASKSGHAQATAEERSRADVLYQQLRGRYRDDVAAARAETRFVREMNILAGNPVYQKGACVAGLTSDHIESPVAEGGDLVIPTDCPPVTESIRMLKKFAEPYFAGWKGKVDVGPLQQVDQSSTHRPSETPIIP